MVKIHFLQKVLKKWSSFRKKIIFLFHTRGGRGGSGPYMEFSIIDFIFFLNPSLRKGLKKIMENFFFGSDWPKNQCYSLKFFICIGGFYLGTPQAPPPRLCRHILRWQNYVKAKIVHVMAKIMHVVAVIAAKSGIWGAKICLSKSSFIIFWKIF